MPLDADAVKCLGRFEERTVSCAGGRVRSVDPRITGLESNQRTTTDTEMSVKFHGPWWNCRRDVTNRVSSLSRRPMP